MFNRFARGGRGVRKAAGQMNGDETAYASELANQQAAGNILWWKFGAFTMKLAPDLRYTPDFAILKPDYTVELHEVKGRSNRKAKDGSIIEGYYAEGDAKVKIKAAAEIFPFVFKVAWRRAKRDGGGWKFEEIGNPAE